MIKSLDFGESRSEVLTREWRQLKIPALFWHLNPPSLVAKLLVLLNKWIQGSPSHKKVKKKYIRNMSSTTPVLKTNKRLRSCDQAPTGFSVAGWHKGGLSQSNCCVCARARWAIRHPVGMFSYKKPHLASRQEQSEAAPGGGGSDIHQLSESRWQTVLRILHDFQRMARTF